MGELSVRAGACGEPAPRRSGRSAAQWGVAALGGFLLAFPGSTFAVPRSCGPDAIANTQNVLCMAPSGPCTATAVTLGDNIEVADAGCAFDLGGRAFSVQKTLQMTGLGFIRVTNAGNITVTGTGKLKARGDFIKPNGFIIQGGSVSLTSAGTITMLDRAQIDVSGDGAGTIRLIAMGTNGAGIGVDLQTGSVLSGQGISSFTDTGDRFADGGTLEVTASTGSIVDNATITVSGANGAMGGEVIMRAARDIGVGQLMDVTGGGSDGGDVDLLAGDNVTITKTITVDSRLGGGYGGTITLAAGVDQVGGVVPGGALTVNDTALELNGSDAETFGGDGGDLDASAYGPVQFIGTRTAIRASGGTLFDGSGGSIFLSSGDFNPNALGPLDGELSVAGIVTANGGAAGGDGGMFDVSAGRNLTLTARVNVSGKDSGGDVTGDAGGAILLNGTINATATNAVGDGGYVDFTAGLASNAGLTVAQDILASGGASSGGGQSISLAGCTLAVNDAVKVDGHAGVDALNRPGGSDVDLIARGLMQLKASSQYLANPGGTITITHPPAQSPVIGTGVVFNPPAIDNPLVHGPYPNCPVCGDGIRQAGEVCDNGAAADGACCNATCTALVCPTPTTTATMTPTRTPTPTTTLTAAQSGAPTPTPSGAATTSPTPTAAATASPTRTATPTPIATVTPTPTLTVTATPTSQPNVDHFKCYKSRRAAGAPAFVQREVTLEDQFESKRTTVIRTDSFCNPVDKDGEGINDPTAHLQCYKIRDAAGQEGFASRDLLVDNQFGVQVLTAKKASLLCVPSRKDGQPSALLIDHFKCYTARTPSGSPQFVPRNVALTDQFESKLTTVTEPVSVCDAVDKNGEGVMSPAAQLHCYKIKDAPGEPTFARRSVVADNQLGSEPLSVLRPRLLCVPSLRLEPARCGDGYLDPGEQCDDGNNLNGDGCSASCTLELCGNDVVDGGEQCDAGAANGLDNCCSTSCQLLDPDGDGICNRDDICPADADNDSDGDGFCIGGAFNPPAVGGGDPCSRLPGAGAWIAPKAVFTKLALPAGDEKMTLKGAFLVASGGPALALETFGVHVRVIDNARNLIVDERIPGGAYLSSGLAIGWKVSGTPPVKWTYIDKANKPPLQNGIKKVVVTDKSAQTPGLITVVVAGAGGIYALAPGQEPLTVTVALNDTALPSGSAPGTDRCGEVVFASPPSVPSCVLSRSDRLTCK